MKRATFRVVDINFWGINIQLWGVLKIRFWGSTGGGDKYNLYIILYYIIIYIIKKRLKSRS